MGDNAAAAEKGTSPAGGKRNVAAAGRFFDYGFAFAQNDRCGFGVIQNNLINVFERLKEWRRSTGNGS